MINDTDKQEVIEYMSSAALTIGRSERLDSVYRIVGRLSGGGIVYRFLASTPEQISDVYLVLVDDRLVVGFELERSGNTEPFDIEIYSVDEYKKMGKESWGN